MNFKLNLGTTHAGAPYEIDLFKDNIHTIFLTGETGSGKSVLLKHIYQQLTHNYTPKQFQFVLLDMTRVSFSKWDENYLYFPRITNSEEALSALSFISNYPPLDEALVILIEECDMMCIDPNTFEACWQKIHDPANNLYVIFSTSSPRKDVFTQTIKNATDMVIACKVSTVRDSNYVVASEKAFFLHTGMKVVFFPKTSKTVILLPFADPL